VFGVIKAATFAEVQSMIAGTKGYAEEAEELVKRYESIPSAEKHRLFFI
jgi:hypothetical protein